MNVPVSVLGEDACPGIRKGGFLQMIRRTVPTLCRGDAVPPCFEVDVSALEAGETVLLRDLRAREGVSITSDDMSLPVCKIGGKERRAGAPKADP